MIRGITSPIRRIVGRIIPMTKNLTTWSIVLGYLLGFAQNNIERFINMGREIGWFEAMGTFNYVAVVMMVISLVFLGFVFALIEKKQNEDAQTERKDQLCVLKDISKKLDGLPRELAKEVKVHE